MSTLSSTIAVRALLKLDPYVYHGQPPHPHAVLSIFSSHVSSSTTFRRVCESENPDAAIGGDTFIGFGLEVTGYLAWPRRLSMLQSSSGLSV